MENSEENIMLISGLKGFKVSVIENFSTLLDFVFFGFLA